MKSIVTVALGVFIGMFAFESVTDTLKQNQQRFDNEVRAKAYCSYNPDGYWNGSHSTTNKDIGKPCSYVMAYYNR